jgi:hypothetical protein
MAFNFERITFEKQFEQIDNTKKWLRKIGTKTNNTRFEKIYNYNKKIVEHYKNNTIHQIIEEYDNIELSIALLDASSFIRIYQAFKDDKNHIYPRLKLKRILEGPYSSWEEDPLKGDNENRNILFELETAAFFKKAGIEIIGFDDVDFNFEGMGFNIQCKRIFSLKRIETNISESANQFTNRAKSQENIKGIICLSIDKLLNKEKFTLKVKALDEIKHQLEQLVIEFTNKYERLWNKFLNINILAVFFILPCSINT